jgi:hypothetical protein
VVVLVGCGGLEVGSGVGSRWVVDLLERFVVWIVVGGGCGGQWRMWWRWARGGRWRGLEVGGGVDCCGWRMWWLEFLFFLFFLYVALNTVKYFSEHFSKCNQTLENKPFSLKSFAFENILRCKIFYSEINGA